ncbi:MAG: sugar ABC transporter ATP-binding protein [Eubacteriales bacterium]|nr:sugar ABC transporter ATP-binding protein [Eubacteriales bacterium]
MSEYVLEMNHIDKSFPGVKALQDVSLKVRPGTVHALVGENGAGKSTLMKCLFGIYQKDAGEIIFDGEKLEINSARQALDAGISMIHQELHPIRFRPVMENIWLGRFPKIAGIAINHHKMRKMTRDLFSEVGLDISPDTIAGDLSASNLQLVEIAKAVSYHSKIIIMDEPTSSLTENETKHLFRIIEQLQSNNCAIIYISHKMNEIKQIADEVTILRDGQLVGSYDIDEITIDEIINKMVGRELTNRFPEKDYESSDEVVLRVEGLSSSNPKSFKDVSFDLRRGEILGIGGLVGAQRTELVETIFGLRGIESGKIYINNEEVKIRHVSDAKKHHIALLTEERRATGIFPVLPITDNTVIANAKKYSKMGVISSVKRHRASLESNTRLATKTPSMATLIQDLSGGNQQKVLLARWLLTEPEILILDEPTRGIDVGAKYEIYLIMQELAKQGKSIIMISSEMPELIGMSDRVLVMCEGRKTGILEKEEATQVSIMNLATKFMDKTKADEPDVEKMTDLGLEV